MVYLLLKPCHNVVGKNRPGDGCGSRGPVMAVSLLLLPLVVLAGMTMLKGVAGWG